MSLELATRIFKAASDPSRLRLLALLERGEASVGELQTILEQSQPRVSRHLRLLTEAGLVERFRDGQWIYYRLAATPVARNTLAVLDAAADSADTQMLADYNALRRMTEERQREAWQSGSARRTLLAFPAAAQVDDQHLRDALDDALGGGSLGEVLVVGRRAGSLLGLLAPRASQAAGVAPTRALRLLARSSVHAAGLTNCTIRDASPQALPFEAACFDVVLLDEVLGQQMLPVLREAVRVLRPGGRLLILDRVRPAQSRLSAEAREPGLAENHLLAALAEAGCRLSSRSWLPGRAMEHALFTAVVETSQPRTGSYD
jgi:DNA-binding transcriptional ArsR family regulator